jgi:hypothetical protein
MLIVLTLNFFYININRNQEGSFNNQSDDNLMNYQDLVLQDVNPDNSYSGIGTPWNVTHWANRTETNMEVSFTNDSYDIVEIPLGSGWEGYELNANIKNLTDTRNWCSGSFNYGSDNNYQNDGNDTDYISNSVQNWTYGEFDYFDDNDMSGNYIDNTDSLTDYQDCLELIMNGINEPGDVWGYDGQDRGYWTSYIALPRGRVIDSEIKFDIRDKYLMPSNNFELRISINDIAIYSIGALSIREACEDSWRSFNIPQGLWINSSSIFTNPINNSMLKLNFTLIFAQPDGYYTFEGFENDEYQQLFIDNIEFIAQAETKPSQIQLKMNNISVTDDDWGTGTVNQNNTWITNPVQINFSSTDVGDLGGYTVNLNTDIDLYVRKDSPETNYETNTVSLGTIFSVSNNSIVNWECYSYFAVPTGYIEAEMRLEFPTDVSITWISEPQDPSTNRLSFCDNSTQGKLIVPVNDISTTPDGYWKIKATSPNYCEQLNIYNNVTGVWFENNTFLSGDYVNITSKITNSSLISGYIQQTEAQLSIRFPNGTIWDTQNQFKSPDTNGNIYFDYIRIPSLPPDYEVGIYQAIVSWNNSYISGINETGVIYKEFTVIHNSILSPEEYLYDDVFEGEIINLKVSFNDRENFNAIQEAIVYLDNFLGGRQYFSEISPGYYFLEFNTTGGIAGINTLTIIANSSLYTNTQVNVSVELILELVVQPIGFEDTIDAEIGDTIIIQLQLLDPNTNNSIENASITYSWKHGVDSINQTDPGIYQANIDLPDKVKGNYKFELEIIPQNSTYKTTLYSFIVVISDPIPGADPFASLFLWIIIGVLVSIASVLGVLSIRSYVILPRKRKKEAELLSKTQRFKDLRNIQAIVIVHRISGIPLYTKTYSILEKHKRELFSGFIQAITTIGEEFTEDEKTKEKLDKKKESYGNEKIIELDFKYFYCLIADKEDIRVVFVLKEKSSERLKTQISHLMLALNLKLSQELENWDGSLDLFEEIVPKIIAEYFELYYKGSFTLPRKLDLFKLRKEKTLSKMEIRVLNVVQSMLKRNEDIINLNSIIELISEENKDLVIRAIEVLIERKLIIPIKP